MQTTFMNPLWAASYRSLPRPLRSGRSVRIVRLWIATHFPSFGSVQASSTTRKQTVIYNTGTPLDIILTGRLCTPLLCRSSWIITKQVDCAGFDNLYNGHGQLSALCGAAKHLQDPVVQSALETSSGKKRRKAMISASPGRLSDIFVCCWPPPRHQQKYFKSEPQT